MDALEMLRQDHRKVQELFKQFGETEDSSTKKRIVKTALNELKLHAALEEELFYPAVRRELEEEEKIDEAEEEHHVVKLLISELQKMEPDDDHFDAKFKVLAESVKHHIQEEESSVIPEVEGELDSDALGEKMAARKQELQHAMEDGSGSSRRANSASRARRPKAGKRGKAKRR